MQTKPPATPATPRRVTAARDFFSANPDGDCLFSVRAGIPLKDALETAGCLLSAARSVAYAVEDGENDTAAGAAYLIDMAYAVVSSATLSICRDEREGVGQ